MPEDLREINRLLKEIQNQPERPSWLDCWLHWLFHSWQQRGGNGMHRCRVCGREQMFFVQSVCKGGQNLPNVSGKRPPVPGRGNQ